MTAESHPHTSVSPEARGMYIRPLLVGHVAETLRIPRLPKAAVNVHTRNKASNDFWEPQDSHPR